MLHSTNPQSVNQNDNEITLYICQNGYYQKCLQITNVGEHMEKRTLVPCWWDCKLVKPVWETVETFQETKIELPYDPAIPLLSIYLKKTKTVIQKDTQTPVFTVALFAIAKIWKKPKCPWTYEWIEKLLHIWNRILLNH